MSLFSIFIDMMTFCITYQFSIAHPRQPDSTRLTKQFTSFFDMVKA